MPLSEDAQEMFSMVTPEGLFTPHHVHPVVLNATGYLQATMGDVLDGYIDKIRFGVGGRHHDLGGDTGDPFGSGYWRLWIACWTVVFLLQPTRPFSSERTSSVVAKSSLGRL